MKFQRYDVIVIGGGAAGLSAAVELRKRNKKILVVEARERLGGRLSTRHLKTWKHPVELGPEFIHGSGTISAKLIGKKNFYEVSETHLFFDGKTLKEDDQFWKDVELIFSKMKKTKKDRSFLTFLESLKAPLPAKRVAKQYVEGFHAADPKKASVNALAALETSDENYKLNVGYDELIKKISPKGIDYRLNTEVFQIHWKKNDVRVETNRNTFHGKKVLVTLPISILKEKKVKFFPALPSEKRRALSKLHMGMVLKVVFLFRKRLWPTSGFFHRTGVPFPTWWTTEPKKSNILTGWMGGPAVAKFVGLSPDAVAESALKSLADIIQVPYILLNENLVDFAYHDWQSDPFSYGSYSYIAVGGEDAPAKLSKPVKDTLFFAGEATYAPDPGTVNGALVSGKRAAEEIFKA